MFLSETFWYTVLIVGAIALLGLLRKSYSRETLKGLAVETVIAFPLVFVTNWLILYYARPPMTGPLGGYIWLIWPTIVAVLVFGIGDVLAHYDLDLDHNSSKLFIQKRHRPSFGSGWVIGAIAVVVMIVAFTGSCMVVPFKNGESGEMARMLTVQEQGQAVYPPTDPNHMVLVPIETAIKKANQAIAVKQSGSQDNQNDQDNQGSNLGTLFDPGEPELMSVNDHLYWISELKFSGWRIWKQVNQVSPGYIVIDAEDPNAKPVLKDQFAMRYTTSAYFANKLERQLYDRGYSHFNFDGITLEVTDDWQPMYTVALDQPHVRISGNVPVSMLVVNPQTGEINEYGLDKIPDWVDRVYSAETIKKMVGWWGKWNQVDWQICCYSGANQFEPSGDPVLVYTKGDGGHPKWQISITSKRADLSIAGLMLVDARSSKAELYNSLDGTAIERDVLNMFLSTPKNIKKLRPSHLSMHVIYGEPTWVVSYITSEEQATLDPGEPFQGVGFLPASKGLANPSNVVLGETKEEATAKYLQLLAKLRSGAGSDISESRQMKTIEGTVAKIVSQTEDGNTVYVLQLTEDPTHLYRVSYDISIELPLVGVGDKVSVEYLDVGQTTVTIGKINDLNVSLVP